MRGTGSKRLEGLRAHYDQGQGCEEGENEQFASGLTATVGRIKRERRTEKICKTKLTLIKRPMAKVVGKT